MIARRRASWMSPQEYLGAVEQLSMEVHDMAEECREGRTEYEPFQEKVDALRDLMTDFSKSLREFGIPTPQEIKWTEGD